MSASEELIKTIHQAVQDSLIDVYDKINTNHEELVEITTNSEQIISNLLLSYQELALGLEIAINRLCKTDEEREDFRNEVEGARSTMLNWIKEATKAGNVPEETLAEALGSIFPGHEDIS